MYNLALCEKYLSLELLPPAYYLRLAERGEETVTVPLGLALALQPLWRLDQLLVGLCLNYCRHLLIRRSGRGCRGLDGLGEGIWKSGQMGTEGSSSALARLLLFVDWGTLLIYQLFHTATNPRLPLLKSHFLPNLPSHWHFRPSFLTRKSIPLYYNLPSSFLLYLGLSPPHRSTRGWQVLS